MKKFPRVALLVLSVIVNGIFTLYSLAANKTELSAGSVLGTLFGFLLSVFVVYAILAVIVWPFWKLADKVYKK